MSKDVLMPALGMAQETGTLIRWLKAPGEAVAKGEPLMEIETDKATVEIEAPADGVLADVTAAPGDVVPVGKTIGVLLAAGEKPKEKERDKEREKDSSLAASPLLPRSPAPLQIQPSPVAARMAAEHGLDLAQIKP